MVDASGFHTDLNNAQWTIVAPLLPAARPGGCPRTTRVRSSSMRSSIFCGPGANGGSYPGVFRPGARFITTFAPGSVRACGSVFIGQSTAWLAGRSACPSLVIMDGQSVKTTERGGVRGFDGHKLVRGRKRHILVDTLGLIITSRVEPANLPDQRAGARLLAGLRPLFPAIRTVMADAGHQSRELTRHQLRHDGWRLRISHRGQRAFRIKGLTWIVERSFAWLGRNRRFSKDYEYQVQTSETLIDIAAIRLMLNRIAP
jgi:putative transposase